MSSYTRGHSLYHCLNASSHLRPNMHCKKYMMGYLKITSEVERLLIKYSDKALISQPCKMMLLSMCGSAIPTENMLQPNIYSPSSSLP